MGRPVRAWTHARQYSDTVCEAASCSTGLGGRVVRWLSKVPRLDAISVQGGGAVGTTSISSSSMYSPRATLVARCNDVLSSASVSPRSTLSCVGEERLRNLLLSAQNHEFPISHNLLRISQLSHPSLRDLPKAASFSNLG